MPEQKPPIDDRIKVAVEEAQDLFWQHIAASFPESTGGEFGISETLAFDQACEAAVNHWIDANCLKLRYTVGQYVIYTPGFPESQRNLFAIVTENGVECLDPDARSTFEAQGISPECRWENIEHIEPFRPDWYMDYKSMMLRGEKISRQHRLYLDRKANAGDEDAQAIIELHQSTFEEF